MSSTIAATAVTQRAVRASRPGSGPAPGLTDDTATCGLALSTGGIPGSWARAAVQLLANAWLASVAACSSLTPGFRRTSTCIQPHWYLVKYVVASPVPVLPANVVIGM